jgi:hypothetical protein
MEVEGSGRSGLRIPSVSSGSAAFGGAIRGDRLWLRTVPLSLSGSSSGLMVRRPYLGGKTIFYIIGSIFGMTGR